MDDIILDYYNSYDEDGRLFRDKVHQMEYITTMNYFKKLFIPGSNILDACAGTGNYAFTLAELGHRVTAGDITLHNIEIMKKKQCDNPVLQDIYTGNVLDLSCFRDEIFDIVLCMGAFYHLSNDDRKKALAECLRILKPKGLLVISYINTMATTMVSVADKLENMDDVVSWYHTKENSLFLHMTPIEIEQLSKEYNTEIVSHIATDGIGYLIKNKVNEASNENYDKWVQFHLSTCEDRSLLGYSLHGLIVLMKV